MQLLRKIIRWLLVVFISLAVILTGLWLLNAPENLDEDSHSFARLDRAPYKLDSMTLAFVDESRSTPALGEFAGDRVRKLKGTVWFPKTPDGEKFTKHPLLVFSHGFGSYHKGSKHIAQYLARQGYVVAAVDFPLSNAMSPAGSPQLLDIVNQPGDVSAVIDRMSALNRDEQSVFFQRIDINNVGAYGLSLGGLTTALVTFHPDYQDTRIKAVAMMAPPLESFSDQFYASNSNVESLVLSGTMDRVVPAQANAEQIKALHPKGWFLSFDKGSHLGFANVGNPIRWMNNPDDLGCAMMGRMLSKLTLPDRWSKVLPNTGDVLRDIAVPSPCPELPGEAMNGQRQQWLARIAIGAFFDMHLHGGSNSVVNSSVNSNARSKTAAKFFTQTMAKENVELTLSAPQ